MQMAGKPRTRKGVLGFLREVLLQRISGPVKSEMRMQFFHELPNKEESNCIQHFHTLHLSLSRPPAV